jgi:hypothetical protein
LSEVEIMVSVMKKVFSGMKKFADKLGVHWLVGIIYANAVFLWFGRLINQSGRRDLLPKILQ